MSRHARHALGSGCLLLILLASIAIEWLWYAQAREERQLADSAYQPQQAATLGETWGRLGNSNAPFAPLSRTSNDSEASHPGPSDDFASVPLSPEDDHLPPADFAAETEGFQQALAMTAANVESVDTPDSRTAAIPEELPPPVNAAPLQRDSGDPAPARSHISDDAIRRFIQEALPKSSRAEQEAWLDSLRGMKPAEIRDLLEMRRVLGAETSGSFLALPPTTDQKPPQTAEAPNPPPAPRSTAPAAAPLPETPHLAELAAVTELLTMAQTVILNNIANASTPGFRRSEIVFGAPAHIAIDRQDPNDGSSTLIGSLPAAIGLQMLGTICDTSPGELRTTGRPLDLAIDGAGFFPVQIEGETLLTRAGRCTPDADGTLCLEIDGDLLPIEPAIIIPADALRVAVTSSGEVQVWQADQPSPATVGQLQTVVVPFPEKLVQPSGCLFSIPEAAGRPHIATPEVNSHGTIRSGALEDSNVKLDRELAALEKLQRQTVALKAAAEILASRSPFSRPSHHDAPSLVQSARSAAASQIDQPAHAMRSPAPRTAAETSGPAFPNIEPQAEAIPLLSPHAASDSTLEALPRMEPLETLWEQLPLEWRRFVNSANADLRSPMRQ